MQVLLWKKVEKKLKQIEKKLIINWRRKKVGTKIEKMLRKSWKSWENIENIARGTTDPGYWVYNLNHVSDWNWFEIILAEKLNSSYGLNTLGPLCLWQCFFIFFQLLFNFCSTFCQLFVNFFFQLFFNFFQFFFNFFLNFFTTFSQCFFLTSFCQRFFLLFFSSFLIFFQLFFSLPLALVSTLASRWRHLHCHIA